MLPVAARSVHRSNEILEFYFLRKPRIRYLWCRKLEASAYSDRKRFLHSSLILSRWISRPELEVRFPDGIDIRQAGNLFEACSSVLLNLLVGQRKARQSIFCEPAIPSEIFHQNSFQRLGNRATVVARRHVTDFDGAESASLTARVHEIAWPSRSVRVRRTYRGFGRLAGRFNVLATRAYWLAKSLTA